MKISGWITEENNLARQASVTITNPADSTNYPAYNLIRLPVSRTARLENRSSNKIYLTFPGAVSIDFAALVGHNLSSGATITLRAGATYDAATVSETVTWRRRTAFKYLSSAQNYQFWSVQITDDANENPYIEAGYIVLGVLSTSSYGFENGWLLSDLMVQAFTESPTGTPDVRPLSERQMANMTFGSQSSSEIADVRNLFLSQKGRDKPLFFVPDTLVNDGFFGRFEQDGFEVEYTNDSLRSVSLTLLEDPDGFSLEPELPHVRFGEDLPSGYEFTRASTAFYKDSDLLLVSAAVDAIRSTHYLEHGKVGILLEDERTNGFTYSEDLSNAAWTKTRSSITANAVDEPKATASTTADKLVEDATASATHLVSRTFSVTSDNTLQAISFFAKAAERSFIRVQTTSKAGNDLFTNIGLSDGSIGATQQHSEVLVEDYGNSWYRIQLAFDSESGGTTPLFAVLLGTADGTYSYTGDGSSGAYLWGIQWEEDDAFPSSYISTGAATATRNTDKLSVPWPYAALDPFTWYMDFWDVGQSQHSGGTDHYLAHTHRSSVSADPRVLLRGGDGLQLVGDDSSGTTNPTGSPVYSPGDGMEVRAVLAPGGEMVLGYSVNRGTESSSEDTTPGWDYDVAGNLADAWIAIGHSTTATLGGTILLKRFLFSHGEQTLATMRLM